MVDYINQLYLINKGLEPNKNFLKSLYKCKDLQKVSKWFDELDCHKSRRQPNNVTSLSKFLKGINSESFIALQIGSPDPFDIKYCASFRDSKKVSRLAWVACPNNENNFNIIEAIYKESFKSNLKDEPIKEGLREYYNWRKNLGY